MELHEITVVKGINPEAQFSILKEDTNMTSEVDLNSVMERLEARLDAMEKGEIPPQLREHIKDKKDDEPKEEKKDGEDMKEEKKDDDKMAYMKGEEFGDVHPNTSTGWKTH